jgi:hypothetical protein
MKDPYTRIKMSSVQTHPSGATSFELETVPRQQAWEEAMANTNAILGRMYEKDPSSFRVTILDFGGKNPVKRITS